MRSLRTGPSVHHACALALALVGCNDHRYGFFGDTDGGVTTGAETTTDGPTTTVSPTTVQPTTLPPTTITTETTVTTTPPPTVTSVTSVTTEGTGCGFFVLPAAVPTQGFASLAGQPDAFALGCGGAGGSDVAFLWRAPFTGRFVVDTLGSNVDTLLGVLDGECAGVELACDDDGGPDLTSRVEVDLFEGQAVTFVVDSFSAGFGDVVLNVAEVPIDATCPDDDFGTQLPLTAPGQTAGASNVRVGSCGGFDAPEIEALWTAPFAGLYRFEIVESDFDPVMYLQAGACGAPELICSDDGVSLNPAFDVFLETFQPVLIVVDGAGGSSGSFTLSVSLL